MNGFIENIEKLSLENDNFRKVLYTDRNIQLVVMSLLPGEEIGEEVHDVDQFLRIEQGTGKAVINGASCDIADGSAVIVPVGVNHNIMNTSSTAMKLYTIYTPPHHRDGTVHKTKADAQSSEEHFDGAISEQ